MIIDCAPCPVQASTSRGGPSTLERTARCDDCVVTALTLLPPSRRDVGEPPLPGDVEPEGFDLDVAEWEAVRLFVDAGLVSRGRARLLRALPDPDPRGSSQGQDWGQEWGQDDSAAAAGRPTGYPRAATG